MIGGFIMSGGTGTNVLVRAIGPTLSQAGVNGALEDTTLQLFDGNGNVMRANDNWKTDRSRLSATRPCRRAMIASQRS